MRDDAVYLQYIDESIQLIEAYLGHGPQRLTRERFFTDRKTQDAVLRRLETLSDAAGHLSDALRARYPDIPWRLITDFRNVLAHSYTDIQMDEVWAVIADDLGALKAAVQAELARLQP